MEIQPTLINTTKRPFPDLRRIGHDNRDVESRIIEDMPRRFLVELFGLEDRNVRFQSHFLNGGGNDLLSPAPGSIRLGDDPSRSEG